MAVPEYLKAGRLGFLALRGAHGDAFVLVLRVGVQQVTRLRLKSDRLLLFDLEGSFKAQVDFVHRRAVKELRPGCETSSCRSGRECF
jgi:hypothetical protein